MIASNPAPRITWHWPAVQAAFVLSGACALAYEIVWGRWLATILGSSAIAACVVIASYMGGLAAGAGLFGRISARSRSPLLLYVAIEALIGTAALAFPALADLALGLPGPLRVAAAVAILSIPTILMGGTLPLVLAWSERVALLEGQTLARLYGLNTVGAAVGCVLAGFWLVPAIGLSATNELAACGNFFLGAVMYVMARLTAATSTSSATSSSTPAVATETIPAMTLHLLAFLSGLVALGLEILWIRLLRITLGSTTYTLTLVIATFILGIGIGGLVAGRVPEEAGVKGRLARAQLMLTLLLFVQFAALPLSIRLFGQVVYRPNPWYGVLGNSLLVCALLLLPVTILMGYIFPLLGRLYMRRGPRGLEVGIFYAINTVGAVLGAVVTTVVLIPGIGSSQTYMLFVGCMVVALVVYARLAGREIDRRSIAIGAMAVGIALLVTIARPGWSPSYLGYRAFGGSVTKPTNILYFNEGRSSTVVVEEADGALAVRIDGKPVASTVYIDLANQYLLGHLPAVLTSKVETGLVVGLGTGITLGSLAQHGLKQLDLVELERNVVDAARFFADHNHAVMDSPELRLIIDDGLNHLHATNLHYDVITSDPIQPYNRGAATLYSAEYFARASKRLTADGVMAHWLPLANMSPHDFRLILRTFASVFPFARLYWSGAGDSILVGRNVPWNDPTVDPAQFVSARQELSRIYIDSEVELASLLMAERAEMLAFAGDGELNTVDMPILEFTAPPYVLVNTKTDRETDLLNMREQAAKAGTAWEAVGVVLAYRTRIAKLDDPSLSEHFLHTAVPCANDGKCDLVQASGMLRRQLWEHAVARGDRSCDWLDGARSIALTLRSPHASDGEFKRVQEQLTVALAAYESARALQSSHIREEVEALGWRTERYSSIAADWPQAAPVAD